MKNQLIFTALILSACVCCQAQDNLKKFMRDSIHKYNFNVLSTAGFSQVSSNGERSGKVYTFDEAITKMPPGLIAKLKNTFLEDSKYADESSLYSTKPDSLFYIMTFGGCISDAADSWGHSSYGPDGETIIRTYPVDGGAMLSVGRDSVSFTLFYAATTIKRRSEASIPYKTLRNYMEQAHAKGIATYHPVKYMRPAHAHISPAYASPEKKGMSGRDSTYMGIGVTIGYHYEIKKSSQAKKMFAQLTDASEKLFSNPDAFSIRKKNNRIYIVSFQTHQYCAIELNKDGSLSYMFVESVDPHDLLVFPDGDPYKYHYSYKGQLYEEVPENVLKTMNQE